MTIASSLALFASMVLLAFIPGPGILAVVGRTLAAGLRHGVSTAAGIVAGDFVFITLALLGLAVLSGLMGDLFAIAKYLGAGYLIWLGLSLAFSTAAEKPVRPVSEPRHLASFAAGLFTTLGNPKAILFYLSFLPGFVDLSQVSVLDAAIIYIIATVAVGGVMLGYACAAHKAQSSIRMSQRGPLLRYGAGALLVGSGLFVAIRG